MTTPDYGAQHQRLLTLTRPAGATAAEHDWFDLVVTYRNSLDHPDRLRALASVCVRRIAQRRLPSDLATAYDDLAALATWQAGPKEPIV